VRQIVTAVWRSSIFKYRHVIWVSKIISIGYIDHSDYLVFIYVTRKGAPASLPATGSMNKAHWDVATKKKEGIRRVSVRCGEYVKWSEGKL
jgi:hypothetical protein